MNKLFTRIMASVAGFAMAVGVGVGISTNFITAPSRVEAAENDTHVFDDIAFSRLLNNSATINSVSIAQQDYTVKKIVANVRYNKTLGGVTITPTIGTTVLESKTHNESSTVDLTWNVSPAIKGQITFDFVNNCGSGTGKGTFYFNSVTLTEGAAEGSPTVDTVTVSGSMTNKSYNTVQSWNNEGLTASAVMTNSLPYTGDFDWTYSPATPVAAVLANNNEEVTNLSVTATASAEGKSGSKSTSGITVNYATVEEVTAATPASGTLEGVIAKGIISQIDEVSTEHGNATYFISDDGTTSGQYEVFRGKGLNNAAFETSNDIRIGDTVVVYGNVTTYSGTKEFAQGNYILSLERAASSDPVISITTGNISMNVGDEDVLLEATAENIPDGGSVVWESSSESVVEIVEDGGDFKAHAVGAGQATITAKILNSNSQMVAEDSITATITAITRLLENGDTFIIKSVYSETAYYMTGVNSDNLGTVSESESDAMIFTAFEGETAGQFQFKNDNVYLSFSGSKNAVQTTTNGELASTFWTAINDGTIDIIENVSSAGRRLQFNYNSGNSRFACYTSSQTPIIVEKVIAPEVDEVIVTGPTTADAQNATSITKTFEYLVSYVDVEGNGRVNVSVLNSSDEENGASITTSPSNGSFGVTFTANDTYTITVTSDENHLKYDSMTIVVSNIYTPVSTNYELYTGTIVSQETTLAEGDYIFVAGENAMKAAISSDRAQNADVEISNGVISSSDSSIVWHIAPYDNDYYTIYNEAENKYLASTGANNKAQLLEIDEDMDDKALWSVSFIEAGSVFDFVNKFNNAAERNDSLRKNGDLGFACYSSGYGTKPNLYRRSLNSYLDTGNSIASLSARETAGGGEIEEGSVVMRFGITMPKASWDSINSAYPITNYGIMCLKRTTLNSYDGSNTVEQAYHNGKKVTNFNRGNGDTPYAIENIYKFTVRIENIASTDYDTTIVVAPYVIAGGQYYFFREMEYNVRTLAQEYLNNTSLQIALSNAALRNLAGINA